MDAAEVIAAVCTESCGPDRLPADIGLRLFSSVDGGVTWAEIDTLTTPEYPAGFTTQSGVRDVLVAGGEGPAAYRLLLGGTLVVPPTPGVVPIFLSDGRILWGATDGRLLWPDGAVFAVLGQPVEFGDTAAVNEDGQLAVAWRWPSGDAGGSASHFVVHFDADGTPVRGLALAYKFVPLAWWSDHQIIGTQVHEPTYGRAAVTYDLISGLGEQVPIGLVVGNVNSRLLSIQHGPFAVVRFTDGTCLNIRSQPGQDGTVVDCLADAVLLRDLNEVRLIDGVSWLRVRTPTGVEGWASTEYLEARRP